MTIKNLFNNDIITHQYDIYIYNSKGYLVDAGIYSTLQLSTLRVPIKELTINCEARIVTIKLEEVI